MIIAYAFITTVMHMSGDGWDLTSTSAQIDNELWVTNTKLEMPGDSCSALEFFINRGFLTLVEEPKQV